MMLFEKTIEPPPGKTAECHVALIRIKVSVFSSWGF